MPQTCDILIIGAGPSSVASVLALPRDMSVVVATGCESSGNLIGVHPKIRTEAVIRREKIGITGGLYFENNNSGMLADTSTIGGLANYWGQQFISYEEGDKWPRDFFSSYSDYIQSCSKIESLFSFSVPSEIDLNFRHEDYVVRAPRLLLGSNSNPKANLYSMRDVFFSLTLARDISVVDKRVLGWIDLGYAIRVYFSDGTKLDAKRLVLAAGVVGSLRLCMNSCENLQSVKFSDHSPIILYFLRMSNRASFLRNDEEHFNNLTMELIQGGNTKLFASLYRMSRAPVGLIMASLGLPPFLTKVYPPNIIDIITPIQVWTEKGYMSYRIDRNSKNASLLSFPDEQTDGEMVRLISFLSNFGKILAKSKTKPGFGFHYHAGEVSFDGGKFIGIADFLRNQYREKIICADASMLPYIGLRPHTLTAMAAAFKNVSCSI
jgi:hypothetical protein